MNERYVKQTYSGEVEPVAVESVSVSETSPEQKPEQIMVRRYLQSINEPALRDIFSELAGKTGRGDTPINFIPLSAIKIIDDESFANAVGIYISDTNEIALSPNHLENDPSETLHTLIHEELHAVTNNSQLKYEAGHVTHKLLIGVTQQTTAWREDNVTNFVRSDEFYDAANEGITEIITEWIFREYLRRTGDQAMYGLEQSETTLANRRHRSGYGKYQKAVEMYTKIISAVAAISEESAQGAIMRSYFRSGSILPTEIISELNRRLPGLSDQINDILNNDIKAPSLIQLTLNINESKNFSFAEKAQILTKMNDLIAEEEAFKHQNADKTKMTLNQNLDT
jgi:hypothetical protein